MERTNDLRLSRLHRPLAAKLERRMGAWDEDSQGTPATSDSLDRGLVSAPPMPPDLVAAVHALAQADRSLQLLRHQRERPLRRSAVLPRPGNLEEVAAATQSANANDVGTVRSILAVAPAPQTHSANLLVGIRSARPVSGRAGWWKSPSPDLVRGPAGGQHPVGSTRKNFYFLFLPHCALTGVTVRFECAIALVCHLCDARPRASLGVSRVVAVSFVMQEPRNFGVCLAPWR